MNPKLSERDVLRMRHLHYDRGWTYRRLAKHYGVGIMAAIRAVTGQARSEAEMKSAGQTREEEILALFESRPGAKLTGTEIEAALGRSGFRGLVYEMWKRGDLLREEEKTSRYVGDSWGSFRRFRYSRPE